MNRKCDRFQLNEKSSLKKHNISSSTGSRAGCKIYAGRNTNIRSTEHEDHGIKSTGRRTQARICLPLAKHQIDFINSMCAFGPSPWAISQRFSHPGNGATLKCLPNETWHFQQCFPPERRINRLSGFDSQVWRMQSARLRELSTHRTAGQVMQERQRPTATQPCFTQCRTLSGLWASGEPEGEERARLVIMNSSYVIVVLQKFNSS